MLRVNEDLPFTPTREYAISKPKTFAGISFYVFFLILASVKLVNYTNLPIRGAARVCLCIENRMNACAFRDIWAQVMFFKLFPRT